jgi:hypothetical protein
MTNDFTTETAQIDGTVSGKMEYSFACCGRVTFRTNGPKGGDGGHGGFLEVGFDTSSHSTALAASLNGAPEMDVGRLTLTYRGDEEIQAAVASFEFLATKLRALLGPR